MANGQRQAGIVRESLQLQFPESKPRTVAATAIGRDHNLVGVRIDIPAFKAPPSANGCYGKRTRVMVGANVHKSGILTQIIDAIWVGPRHRGIRKVMSADCQRAVKTSQWWAIQNQPVLR